LTIFLNPGLGFYIRNRKLILNKIQNFDKKKAQSQLHSFKIILLPFGIHRHVCTRKSFVKKKSAIPSLIGLSVMLSALFIAELLLGPVKIPFGEIIDSLFRGQIEDNGTSLILETRIHRAVTAILAGTGLAIAGWLLQTLFRNPLAGPDVLGISSGASLGVALLVLGAGFLPIGIPGPFVIAMAAMAGAILVLLLLILVSERLTDNTALLIFGIMCGFLASSFVSGLEFKSNSDSLRNYILWGLGSFADTGFTEIAILLAALLGALIIILMILPRLNRLLLGDEYARSMGIDVKKTRTIIIIITGILAGSVTAFCGPVAFIGLAVPHVIRSWKKTSHHQRLLPFITIGGAIAALFCDLICRLTQLPLNTITCAMGAPIVIWIVLKGSKSVATL
jgi:iron complex transport system permease protein